MVDTEPIVEDQVQTDSHICPQCERSFGTKQGLSMHTTRTHGKKKTNRKKSAEVVPVPRPQYDEAIITQGRIAYVNVLEAMFPNGIPHNKISATVDFVFASEHLNA